MLKKLSIISLLLLSSTPGGAVTVIPVSPDSWTCYDHSLNYTAENPNYGMVLLSFNPKFIGVSHYVNYTNLTENSIEIHDGLLGSDYVLINWQEYGYYHFWGSGETPVRNYPYLRDNRKEVLE
ncbi:MAG: hypothetical protein QG646_2627 [Euryarchaeota archaeon]|nr:hypothetical protein [Euryarchaeota archaeon]